MPTSKTSLSELLYDIRRIEQHREKLTENKIHAIYQSLSKDLKMFIAEGYEKYADGDGRFFVSYLDAKNSKARFMQEIVASVDSISPAVKAEIEKLVDDTYQKSYEGMLKAFKKADTAKKFEEITKDIAVNPNVLKQAINNNISKLTLPAVLEKHRGEVIYQIQNELNIGLMQGDRYEKMAKRISERLGVSESKAMNITRTETHRNIESGFMDCAEHIQEGLDESDLIYAATWQTMEDERVRPQQRRKTSKGWKTTLSRNGANHIKMNGVTVKAGEMFDLGGGVKAKAPSQSGVAAHDCNCRCFLEYNLMTVEEFAMATNQTPEKVRKKYNMSNVKENTLTNKGKSDTIQSQKDSEPIKLKLDDYPEAFTKGAEGKNTQKLIDYVNGIEGADPNVLKLYSKIGELENFSANGIPFKISHAKGHSIATTSNRITGEITDVKFTIPKIKGDNIAGQVNTTLHEQMHLIDMFGREDAKKSSDWFSVRNKKLTDTIKNTTADMSDEISALFKKHDAECDNVRKSFLKKYDTESRAIKEKYLPDGMSPWQNMSGYRQYEKEAKKLLKEITENINYEQRNIFGGGICNLEDIYDALSKGTYQANGVVKYGHGKAYYVRNERQTVEIVANYASLSVTRPDLIDMLRRDKPELCEALDEMVIELIAKAGG